MLIDLLNAIKTRLESLDEFQGADVSVAISPRFEAQTEGRLSLIVAPVAVRYERETRDVVKETTIINVALAQYFADSFDEHDENDLLKLTTNVETALMMQDYHLPGADYRWETSYASGDPFTDTRHQVVGGIFDIQAADNAFTLQAPVVVQFIRMLKIGP